MVNRLPGLPGLPDVSPSRGTPTVQQANPSAGMAAASAFDSLAAASRELRSKLEPMLERQRAQDAQDQARADFESARDGAEGEEFVSPALRRAISREDVVYNQTVTELTHARAMNTADRTLAELRREHAFEPEAFREAARGWRDEYLSGVDTRFKTELDLALTGQIDDLEFQVVDERRARDTGEAQQALEMRLDNINARVTSGIAGGGPDFTTSAEFAELQAEAQDVISILVESPQYGWSSERGAQALDDVASAGREAVIYHEADRVLRTQGEAAALGFVDDYLDTQTLDPGERIAQRSRLVGHISNTQRRRDLIAAEQERADRRRRDALEAEGRTALNAVTRAAAEGQPVDPLQIDELQRYSDAGVITPAQFRVAVDAVNADASGQRTNQAALASFFDDARDLTEPVEDLEDRTLAAVAAGNISAPQRETILNEARALRADGMERGVDAIKATFERGFNDFDTRALSTAENAAMNDLMEWRRLNPDAPEYDVRTQAIRFAALRGRELPPPPAPQFRGMALPPRPRDGMSAYEAWEDQARRRAMDLLDSDEDAALRLNQQIEAYGSWARLQMQSMENLNDARE